MSKGIDTRARILDTAFRLAARDGLEGLSLAGLANQLGLSKSGLFAHFKSKEELQLEMLRTGSLRFVEAVLLPAFQRPRGLPRIRHLFENWLHWASDPSLPGGCVFVAAAAELDDREGAVRDYVEEQQGDLVRALARSASIAVEEGHFRKDLDVEQFAFDLLGIYLVFHHARRLLRDPKAARRARNAFARLLESSASFS
jgi:AcrR family transcriptional regulator